MQKIMFNDKLNLTEAVIAKRKQMTRRTEKLDDMVSFIGWHTEGIKDGEYFKSFAYKDKHGNVKHHTCRYGVDEVVAVAEGYNKIPVWLENEDLQSNWYKAGKNNKMFVRPDLMPHQVKITGIKIERLQDISDEDCIKEGIYEETDYDDYDYDNTWYSYYADDAPTFGTPQEAFASLIDELKKGTWECNPWVVCYSFELIK